jgi:hypothetical protein
LIWKWTDEKSEGVQRNLEFAQFKMGKRLKTGEKPNEYFPVDEDTKLYSDLEAKITSGRFLLEKKTKIPLAQPGVRVISCEFSPSKNQTNRIMVIGQSNGVFGLFNVDTLENIHSF